MTNCGLETLSYKISETPIEVKLDYQSGSNGIIYDMTDYFLVEGNDLSSPTCYSATMLEIGEHFSLYTDADHTNEFTNSTQISIKEINSVSSNKDFGFKFTIHNDKFWNTNMTFYAKLSTLGNVSISQQFNLEIGPNCAALKYNATFPNGEAYPTTTSLPMPMV